MKNASFNLIIALIVVTLISPTSLAVASRRHTTKSRALAPVNHEAPEFIRFDEPEPVGLRIVIQAWNPLKPDEHHDQTLVEPTLVTEVLQGAWSFARDRICTQMKDKMGVGGFANGFTLSEIKCVLDERVAFKLTNANQNVLHGVFAVGGYFEAKSTTPDGFPAELDPRLSIAIKANLELTIAIQSNADQTLQVSNAKFTLTDATVDSHNPSADLLKFIAEDLIPFFGGKNYKRFAEDTINSVSVDISRYFNEALPPVNAKLKAPSDLVRVGLSFSSNLINVAFAPRAITPPTNGSMTGQLHWDPAQFTPPNGCQSFDIVATVQVGPTPMFVVDAGPPTRQVGTFNASPVDSHTCSFSLIGLAGGWPNVLTPRLIGVATAKNSGSSIHSVSYSLVGDNWNGRTVVPQLVASNLNYVVSYSFGATAIKDPDFSSKAAQVGANTNSVINPADPAKQRQVETRPGRRPAAPRGDSVMVNKNVPSVGTQSGIIIVGGSEERPARQPVPRPGSGSSGSSGASGSRVPGDSNDGLAARGASLVSLDPAATELSNQLPDDPARRGFYIGMAIAEHDFAPGPGKDRLRDSLPPDQQAGFSAGVSYSLEKNRRTLTDLAPRGAEIAAEVALLGELRSRVEDGPARLGFDIGLNVVGHDTAPGPGKQRIQDTLYPSERAGFALAVEFSLERNRNIELAQIGASIVERDPTTASTRNHSTDVFYRLGFDIATALYGNPALGSRGNTAFGPGAQRIRDALSPKAKLGFNDATNFHLNRKY